MQVNFETAVRLIESARSERDVLKVQVATLRRMNRILAGIVTGVVLGATAFFLLS